MFNMGGTYYIVVEHSGARPETTYYALTASGESVSLPTVAPRAPAAVQPAPAPETAEVATEAAPAEAAPAETAEAPAPSDEWRSLAVGESYWHTFEYDGDGSQIDIALYVDPQNSATFSVWTPEQVRRFALGETVEPVGRGSANDNAPGDQSWSGSFFGSGTYYVRVEQTGPTASRYQLTITGTNVKF
jgi:hypothetical protein